MFDVITIGTVIRDVFIKSPLFRVVSDKRHIETIGFEAGEAQCFALGSKIQIERPVFAGGGGAHNAAVTFARQGLRTGIVGSLGDDLAGKEIVRTLKAEKVTPMMHVDKKAGTGYGAVLLAPGGERTILVYRGASTKLASRDIPEKKMRARWAYVVPGEIPFSVIQPLVHRMKKNGTKIAMNPSLPYLSLKKHETEALYSLLDVLIMNRDEASLLLGIAHYEERKAFREFNRMIPGIAVVTNGKNGAMASDGSYLYKAGTFSEKVIADRTGAGDAFGSGFIAGLIKGNDFGYALRFAAANATSVVESVGATTGVLTTREFSRPRWKSFDLDVDRL